jgi:hypothetical protein
MITKSPSPAKAALEGLKGRAAEKGVAAEKVIGYAPCPVLVRHPGFDTR